MESYDDSLYIPIYLDTISQYLDQEQQILVETIIWLSMDMVTRNKRSICH